MLQYVLLHLHTYIVLRCCTSSCSCTHTSCYAVEAAAAADDDDDDDDYDDDGGYDDDDDEEDDDDDDDDEDEEEDDDDDEEDEELVDETNVFFFPSLIQQWRASQRPGTLFLMHLSGSFKWRKLLLSGRVRISA